MPPDPRRNVAWLRSRKREYLEILPEPHGQARVALSAGVTSLFGGEGTLGMQALTATVAGLSSAGVVWFASKKLEERPGRVFIDKATGQEIKVGASAGSFFFIPTRYWTYILLTIGLAMTVSPLVKLAMNR